LISDSAGGANLLSEQIVASVEVIGLLCAGSTRYHEGGFGGGSSERLSRSELAGLLAGLDKAEMNLALAKYACDLDAERMLIAQVRVWAAGVALRDGWKIVRGRPVVANMAALAVFDVVRPNRCVRCEGRGVVSIKVCGTCSGTGYKALSGHKIADAIGLDACNYRKFWRSRYEECFRYVQALDLKVNSAIHYADKEKVFCVV
jgi:predicted metal-binding protein